MIENSFLVDLATFTVSDVAKVLINDTIYITNFIIKHAIGQTFELKNFVTYTQTTHITNLKLLRYDNSIISSNVVDVPISPSQDTVLRFVINFAAA